VRECAHSWHDETHRVAFGSERPAALDTPLLVLEFEPLLLERLLHLAMTCVELFLGLLETAFLLHDLDLEDCLHLGLHLRELGIVHDTLLLHALSWAGKARQISGAARGN
jgi:hypothetical protein